MPRKRSSRSAPSSSKPKSSTPRRTTPRRSRPRKASASLHVAHLAQRIAETLPFVHFPARTRFPSFLHWERLQSHKARGEATPSGNFEQLRWGHVFAYAGPCCYRSSDSIGDAATYFQPSLDSAQSGAISPFDSGALEDPTPRLQPWASRTLTARWRFLQKYSMPLTGWRAEFQRWLMYCYVAPDRYLDSTPDRYAAGLPDRTRPPTILQHNGPRGRSTHGEGNCADRRAWTWEARFEQPVSLVRLQALHLARDRVQEALREVSRLRFANRLSIDIKALPAGRDASADTLYEDSGRVLRQLMGL